MSKGDRTREAILEQAVDLASVAGLEGMSIGALASRTGLSKSGLFAHFGSKENLQLETLKAAGASFIDRVLAPALRERSGVARLRAIFEGWLAWSSSRGGGCPFVAAAVELDDRPGPTRDYVVSAWLYWRESLSRAAEKAVITGEFKSKVDPKQVAYEIESIYLGYHHSFRLLKDPDAESRARKALDTLIQNAES